MHVGLLVYIYKIALCVRAYCRQQHMNNYLQVAAQCSILLFPPHYIVKFKIY